MAGMKVSLPGMFANIKQLLHRPDVEMADYYSFGLDEIEQHLRELAAGQHTVAEFVEHYCLNEAKT